MFPDCFCACMVYGMASGDIKIYFLLLLLQSTFGQILHTYKQQPEFLAPLENHTVTQGRDVSFTCVVNHLQSYKVAWIKSDSRAILAIHTRMVAQNPRLHVTHNGHNTWKLHVSNVHPNDSGTYMCQINTDPMRSLTGRMKVVIPPDIMDQDENSDLLTTKENGEVRLTCHATGTPTPVVLWRREDGRNITIRDDQGIKRVKSYEGEELRLRGIQRQEMGSYLCIASNGVPPMVSKRYYVNVRFKPLIKVSNQLVAAPANSDVTFQCLVEASPKPMNTWHRDNGEKILTDEKYVLSEVLVSDYSYLMNLTIRNLKKQDYGAYVCVSENEFGTADESVRLQELPLVGTIGSIEKVKLSNRWGKQEGKGKNYLYENREESKPTSKSGSISTHTLTPIRKDLSSHESIAKTSYPSLAHSSPTHLLNNANKFILHSYCLSINFILMFIYK
ncbi:lachesin-like [Prorops nasuta]|uniref:lachesin-like n=1 Tax=Prorops nasuta TaxID=863751 RepID=UPI0034CE7127